MGEGTLSPGPSPTRTHTHPGEGKRKAGEQDRYGTGMDDEPAAAWASARGEVWPCPLGRVLPLPGSELRGWDGLGGVLGRDLGGAAWW